MTLKHKKESKTTIQYVILFFAVVAIVLSLIAVFEKSPKEASKIDQKKESSFDRAKREKKLRVGYAGFPPYTITNPNISDPNMRVTGFCVDMVSEIAKRQVPPWEVEWQKASWESLRADMYSGKFDVLAEGIYQTIPRATDFYFTDPFSYFGVAVAVVRIDETRFKKFVDLDRDDIVISLPEGWTSTEYARKNLKKPKLNVIPVGDDININFMEVINRRADVALQDVPTVVQFVNQHSDQVKALWLDNPPLRVAAGFATRVGDIEMIQFLNSCIRILKADGTLSFLDKKWKGMGEYEAIPFKTGVGIKNVK